MLAFRIALRYIFSKKSTNAINVISRVSMLGMGVGAFALIVVLSVFNGFEGLVFDKIPKVVVKPELHFSAMSFINYMKYLLSAEITDNGQLPALVKFCIGIALLFFFKNLFRYLAVYFLAPIRSGSVRDIREELYAKILSLPLSYYSKERKGDIIARLTDDVKEVEISIISFLEVTVREPLPSIVFLNSFLLCQ